MLAELVRDVARLVVDGGIEAELVDEHRALLRAPGDADGARALDLGDLADGRADRAGGPGDQHGVAVLGAAHVEQAEVRGHAGHAEDAEVRGQRGPVAGGDLEDAGAVGDRVVLDAERALHQVALGKALVARGDHAAEGQRAHRLADLDGRQVRGACAHPPAHRGVDRDVRDLDDELAVGGFRQRHLREPEVGCLGLADGSRGELELAAGAHRCANLSSVSTG